METTLNLDVTIIIPARYNSIRFPGKALIDLGGKPMIQHVYERACAAKLANRVIVATDDDRIVKCVQDFDGNVVVTSRDHISGTDRIAEVAANIKTDIICNVQGDEVGIKPEAIDSAIYPFLQENSPGVTNLCSPTDKESDRLDPNVVKVALDIDGNFLYLTRSPIPYPQSGIKFQTYRQLGVYAFRKSELIRFSNLPPTLLESTEGIEFLRLLEHRIPVRGVVTIFDSFDINVPDDVPGALNMLKDSYNFEEFHNERRT